MIALQTVCQEIEHILTVNIRCIVLPYHIYRTIHCDSLPTHLFEIRIHVHFEHFEHFVDGFSEGALQWKYITLNKSLLMSHRIDEGIFFFFSFFRSFSS